MKHADGKISAGGVVIDDGKVLVIVNRSDKSVTFPKGTVEDDESIEDTAIREVLEETGYQTNIVDNLGDMSFEFTWKDGKDYKKTIHFFLMELSGGELSAQNLQPDEEFDAAWLSIDEARHELTFDDSKDLLEKALRSSKFVQ
jgi:8-oxo-dGTP pyrophosphatase MutT (NUDIX family)